MSYLGHIENGVVVFDEPVPLPNGTGVRVETIADATTNFWQPLSPDELAQKQGVSVPASPDAISGGWPDDELDDGFEDAVERWRKQEQERAQ